VKLALGLAHVDASLSHSHFPSPPLPWPVHARSTWNDQCLSVTTCSHLARTHPASQPNDRQSPSASAVQRVLSLGSRRDAMRRDAMRCDPSHIGLVDPEHSKRLREPLVGCDRSRKYPPRINGQHRVDTEPTLLGDDVSTLGAGHMLVHMPIWIC
jgi:hypothetical protein